MKEPLHIILRKYRIPSMLIIAFFMWLTFDMWEWFQINQKEMQEWVVAGFVSLVLATVGVLKFALESFMKKNEKDDEE